MDIQCCNQGIRIRKVPKNASCQGNIQFRLDLIDSTSHHLFSVVKRHGLSFRLSNHYTSRLNYLNLGERSTIIKLQPSNFPVVAVEKVPSSIGISIHELEESHPKKKYRINLQRHFYTQTGRITSKKKYRINLPNKCKTKFVVNANSKKIINNLHI